MLWRFQLFVSWVITEIFHIWLVVIQTVQAVLQMFRVLIYLSTVSGLLPSTARVWSLSGSLVWWGTCHKVPDLPICYLSGYWERPLGGLHLVFLLSALFRSDARTIEAEQCAGLRTSCESSKHFSVQISTAHPLVLLLWAYSFLFASAVFNDLVTLSIYHITLLIAPVWVLLLRA